MIKKRPNGYENATIIKQSAFGENLSFEASEAFKLLRTNVMFSMTEAGSKVVGVVSSTRHEGKTTTSINLAYSMAQAGKTVLLIDSDMRLPKIAGHLKLESVPGFSDVLAGMTEGRLPIQKSGLLDKLFVLTSGSIPPNPSELLGSKSCQNVFARLKEAFDYIIVDLPPIGIVSDALMLSGICDGYLFVVRNGYSGKREVADCVTQLSYIGAKVLGFVLSFADADSKGYSHRYGNYKGKYYGKGRYGYGDGYGYGYGDGKASKTASANPNEKDVGEGRR